MFTCNLFKIHCRGNDFSGNIVGIAYVNTMCSLASVAVVQDRHTSALATGSTFAHETGHLLGLDHDTCKWNQLHKN